MGEAGMQSHETFPCVIAGRVYERELGKVWQSILASNILDPLWEALYLFEHMPSEEDLVHAV
jgi:hypothetical protein